MVTLGRGVAYASALTLSLVGCGGANPQIVQSPRSDRPAPQTSDGRVVGADNKSPERLLDEQATSAHAAPGWKVDEKGVSYDPKRRPSGGDEGSTKLVHPDASEETLPNGAPPAGK